VIPRDISRRAMAKYLTKHGWTSTRWPHEPRWWHDPLGCVPHMRTEEAYELQHKRVASGVAQGKT
jgi:hypothetical protein